MKADDEALPRPVCSKVHLARMQEHKGLIRLVGGIAHEYNNMLGVIIGHAEMLLDHEHLPEECVFDARQIRLAGERAAKITRQLMAYAGAVANRPERFQLNALLAKNLDRLRREAGGRVRILWHPGCDLPEIFFDKSHLDEIVTTLCKNATEAIEASGKVIFSTRFQEIIADNEAASPGGYVVLSVSDTGCGMEQETIDSLFEPFFTTKPIGEGVGLELAALAGMVWSSGGFLEVSSEAQAGSTVSVYFPVADM